MLYLQLARFLSLGSVVLIDVTILALTFRIGLSVSMRTVSGESIATVSVVAVVAHTFGEVLQVGMRAPSDLADLPLIEQVVSIIFEGSSLLGLSVQEPLEVLVKLTTNLLLHLFSTSRGEVYLVIAESQGRNNDGV